jgi:hypothetical protein
MLVLKTVIVGIQTDGWVPPEDPDPSAILNEARRDVRKKDFETALLKHVWFHEHALKIEPAQYGVRLSFALAQWAELANKHPPAMKKLKEIRDATAKRATELKELRSSFHDVSAINSYLNEDDATVKLFKTINEADFEAAGTIAEIALPSLIHAKEYSLAGQHVSPDDFTVFCQGFDALGEEHRSFAEKSFANKTATLVALLSLTERGMDAARISELAREKLNDKNFHSSLDEALKGKVPKPWPSR